LTTDFDAYPPLTSVCQSVRACTACGEFSVLRSAPADQKKG
jgi:hypothetical protein